jgi:hypothetical protein
MITGLKALQILADSKQLPEAGEGGSCLGDLDEGIFRPT